MFLRRMLPTSDKTNSQAPCKQIQTLYFQAGQLKPDNPLPFVVRYVAFFMLEANNRILNLIKFENNTVDNINGYLQETVKLTGIKNSQQKFMFNESS